MCKRVKVTIYFLFTRTEIFYSSAFTQVWYSRVVIYRFFHSFLIRNRTNYKIHSRSCPVLFFFLQHNFSSIKKIAACKYSDIVFFIYVTKGIFFFLLRIQNFRNKPRSSEKKIHKVGVRFLSSTKAKLKVLFLQAYRDYCK